MSADSQACRTLFFFSDASYVCELIARALKRKICGTIAFTDTFHIASMQEEEFI